MEEVGVGVCVPARTLQTVSHCVSTDASISLAVREISYFNAVRCCLLVNHSLPADPSHNLLV